VGLNDDQEKDLISGDIDKDGDTDLIVARKVPFSTPGGRPNVLFMNEDGIMTDRTASLAPDFLEDTDDRDVVMVDVDGDSWLDVVTVTTFSEQPRILMNLGDDGSGNWLGLDWVESDNRIPPFTPGPKFCAVGFGDVTGNNRPDLFFVDYDNNLEDRLLINNGNGFFTDQTDSRMTAAMSQSAFGSDSHIADMNGDGFNDLIKNNASGMSGAQPSVILLYNDGTGNFDFRDDIYTDEPYMIEIADLTGNGRLDLYVVDDAQDAYMFNTGNDGQGHAQFTTTTVTNSPNTTNFGGNTKIADLDLDGILDILVADVDTDIPGCDRELVLLQGQGTKPNITYEDPLSGAARPWLPNGVFDIEALHIDDDGVLDLWVGTCTANRIFMGTSPGLFLNGFESGDFSAWASSP
ncbi:MAG: VCBS repeat-containing protein, partial [Acidobacteriota bacterium]